MTSQDKKSANALLILCVALVDPLMAFAGTTQKSDTAERDASEEAAAVSSSTSPEGPSYVLERIELKGNRKTLRQVILREIPLRLGQSFSSDDSRLEDARYRLLASGLFRDVQFSLKRGAKRGAAILLISVVERNTIVVQDVVLGTAEIAKFYGSLDVAERSFLGTGVNLSAAVVFSTDGQYGYRLRLRDDHFLNSDFSLHMEGLYANARDFFGRNKVCVEGGNEAEATEGVCAGGTLEENDYQKRVRYAVMSYRRAGIRLGTGYTLLRNLYFSLDYRAEVIAADVPKAGYHLAFGEYRPIEFGHLLFGHSYLSAVVFGILRDTRDSLTLATTGTRTALEVELSSEMLGSDYEFAKFTLTYDLYFRVGHGHSIRLGLFGGLIMGSTPFYNQFFVGDFSSFVPARVLEMNFSHLQPNLLEKTMIKEMRYEDIASSINVEYSLPFYRGHRGVFGVNGFFSIGLFALTSKRHLKVDPEGYSGAQLIPMDLTGDIGIKVDTEVGLFVVSLANLLRLVPGQGAAEE